MKTMNKLLYVFVLSVVLAGCSDFLDVTPKDKQTQEQLFATRNGFYAAVNGVYNTLSSTALYGENLSYKMVDLMALRYAPIATSGSLISAAAQWNYTNTYLKSALSSVWSTAYASILNCNVILDNVDRQAGILSEREATLLRGEMLALRAFLHFDMLRLFGPVYKLDAKAESIPYNESVKITNLPLLPADSVVFHKILRDLDLAEQCLKEDPVIAGGPMASVADEDGTDDVYLRYRQFRLNYYAVLALKARVYLYGQDKENARITAHRLLDDPAVMQHFPAVDPSTLLGNNQTPDRVFSSEVLFGMYMRDRSDIYTYNFDPENASTSLLQPKSDFLTGSLFAGETGDYRYQSQWTPATGVGSTGFTLNKYKALKFATNMDEAYYPFYTYFMPLIRLSEMYFIAAECENELSDKYARLNESRDRRGIPALTVVSEEDLMTRLRLEYLREFYGEGQSFFMYKRLYVNILNTENGYNNNTYGCSVARFVPPLPEGEISSR